MNNMSSSSRSTTIGLEEGWDTMQNAIKNILEGLPEPQITSDNYMILYTLIERTYENSLGDVHKRASISSLG
ncbi:cullin-1-like [Trifolium medium]|uniref:Cullin-1-like n=1 Tax=Trifolium medium TaxID=97028 RepID=A0A392MIT6_9FABA|nr:cullin-1-like [Trifolium medium]